MTGPKSSSECEYESECHERDWQSSPPTRTRERRERSIRQLAGGCVRAVYTFPYCIAPSSSSRSRLTHRRRRPPVRLVSSLKQQSRNVSTYRFKKEIETVGGWSRCCPLARGRERWCRRFPALEERREWCSLFRKAYRGTFSLNIQEHSVLDGVSRIIVQTRKIGRRSKITSTRARHS